MHKDSLYQLHCSSKLKNWLFCHPAKAKFFFLFFCSAQVQVTSNKLTFTNVRLQEDGVYQCVAENNLDLVVSSTWVNVLGKY